MKKTILFSLLLSCLKLTAQVPEDALRYSWYPHNGTARNMAVGGVMGSLGGDITALYMNPAGLGFFKTNEAVITPGYLLNRNKSYYRDSLSLNRKNGFDLGPSGVIIALTDKYRTRQSAAMSFAIRQTANFSNRYHYSGLNNYSSFSEQFAEEFGKSGYSIGAVLNSNSPVPYTVAPALYTYLIDTVTINGEIKIKGAPENILDAGQALMQEMTKTTRGGMYELAAGYAHNFDDKWYVGGGLGIPFIYYDSKTVFSEKDTSSSVANNFSSFSFKDHFTTQGIGFNAKLGLIYRPQEYLRFGFAFHTPTFMTLKDKRNTFAETNLDGQIFSVSSDSFTIGQKDSYTYQQLSPWRAMISGSYVFREVEDVRRQRAFISADIEYINHRGTKFRSDNDEPTEAEKKYYRQLTSVIKEQYKGAFNFRLGGEIKFHTVMARLGAAYYGNPYKNAPEKNYKLMFSGGLGYRNKGFFVDLTYVQQMNKDFDIPYRLEDRNNTYASLKQTQGHVVATVGVKF